ncbi:unnamed protein product [[Actinomadura] parvosata subsp. kistnae]|uniref:Microcin J25-processing protein McjB C-terminal domain-containing protein n=1 Tax=[Actinomadura] parvosata subsp. kistnae TaxID=1909395 RepID=A0A1U9ZT06_9ACTN|nr:lasso peptide biosynthesis B2 protein [Nonomuraea sp. ATCC 55076]AQZ61100.1 hypothetical protein BKM31_06005 [Nonomuraea sp. ATCC 55076]SPL87527.1 unnamed protein product [Actinomadura parvosata subsp. kistnae]
MLQLRIPDHVHHQTYGHGGVVLLNVSTGQWHALNDTAAHLWIGWAGGAGFEESIAQVAGRYPATAPDIIRRDANLLLRDLVNRGLIETDLSDLRMAATMAGPEPGCAARVPWRERLFALGSLLLAVVLLKLPFRATAGLLTRMRGRWCRSELPADRAETAAAAVRHVADWYPGRTACLEISLATVLSAALRRRRLDWCLGAITDPYRFHAWVEIDSRPVAAVHEPADPGYLRVLTL